ncbi:MAG TPA: NUDIX hydrolase [Candidatus Eisenbacteria bacterium]
MSGEVRIKPIVDVCVVAGDKVLLVKYGEGAGHDGQAGWFLPDDLMADFEAPDAAAVRCLAEQTGVRTTAPFLSHVESFRGNDGSWHLAFHFVVQLPKAPRLTPSAGIAETRWFDLIGLPAKRDVAHGGWALATIKEILQRASG